MNEWREKKEQLGRRGRTGWVPKCQDAKWWVGQLSVTPLPSCQCEHRGGPACWLNGDETLGACELRVGNQLLRKHYAKKPLLQPKHRC